MSATLSNIDRSVYAVVQTLPDKSNKHGPDMEKLKRAEAAMSQRPKSKQWTVALDTVPGTTERVPYIPSPNDSLYDAGTARANIAASKEAPNGTTKGNWAEKHKHQTVLQQHCEYFDPDGDGIIWPIDTYRAVRAWGWNVLLSFLAAFLINVNLSYPSSPSWLPDPFFRVHISNIHKDKHGSDSMTYDNEGRFKSQNFEDLFAKYDEGNKGGLSASDLLKMHKGQRMVFDFFGMTATALEWLAVYLLLWPEDGILRKEDVRGVYDGSIFQTMADRYAVKQGKRKQSGKVSKAA